MVNSDSKSPIIEAFKREISLDIDRWGDLRWRCVIMRNP